MSVEYFGDEAVTDVFTTLLATHPDLRTLYEADIVFRVCAVQKTNKDGEPEPVTGPPIKVKKISPEDAPFIEGHYKVYVDMCRWEQANDEQREAAIHHALCGVGIERSEKDGAIRLVKVEPDVVVYQRNVAWYGTYEESLITLRNNLQGEKKGCVLGGPIAGVTDAAEPPPEESSGKAKPKKTSKKPSKESKAA